MKYKTREEIIYTEESGELTISDLMTLDNIFKS